MRGWAGRGSCPRAVRQPGCKSGHAFGAAGRPAGQPSAPVAPTISARVVGVYLRMTAEGAGDGGGAAAATAHAGAAVSASTASTADAAGRGLAQRSAARKAKPFSTAERNLPSSASGIGSNSPPSPRR